MKWTWSNFLELCDAIVLSYIIPWAKNKGMTVLTGCARNDVCPTLNLPCGFSLIVSGLTQWFSTANMKVCHCAKYCISWILLHVPQNPTSPESSQRIPQTRASVIRSATNNILNCERLLNAPPPPPTTSPRVQDQPLSTLQNGYSTC